MSCLSVRCESLKSHGLSILAANCLKEGSWEIKAEDGSVNMGKKKRRAMTYLIPLTRFPFYLNAVFLSVLWECRQKCWRSQGLIWHEATYMLVFSYCKYIASAGCAWHYLCCHHAVISPVYWSALLCVSTWYVSLVWGLLELWASAPKTAAMHS